MSTGVLTNRNLQHPKIFVSIHIHVNRGVDINIQRFQG